MTSKEALDKKRFWQQWKESIKAFNDYKEFMEIDNDSLVIVNRELNKLNEVKSTNDLEKSIRRLWDFDERFFGEPLGYNFEWAVYSLCYLCKDEKVINSFLAIYLPLLSKYIQQELGRNFIQKVGATFIDDVGYYLWDIQDLIEPDEGNLFDWHGNRNDLPMEKIEELLLLAGLPLFDNPDFPPSTVLLNLIGYRLRYNSEEEYLKDLELFYKEEGYYIQY